MRIAVVTSHFPVVSETFVTRQVAALIELGHDVRVFADWPPDEEHPMHPEVAEYGLLERTTYMDMPRLAGYWEQPVWPVWRRTWPPGAERPVWNARRLLAAGPTLARTLVRAPRLTAQVLSPRRYGSKARSLSPLYRLGRCAAERDGFDVIHAHFGWAANDFRFLADLWRAPLVATFHAGGDVDYGRGFDMRTYYADLFQRAATLVTAVSRHTADRLEGLGCPPAKLRLLPTGVDLNEFAFRERSAARGEQVRVLSVGRLVEMKGHEYSIRAMARLRDRQPAVRLDIVGDGPLRAELEALVARLGLGGVVQLHGALPANEVRRLMAEAHLFLLASVEPREGDQEGQTLVLQEAQASGLPVVATDHGPFPEILVPDVSAMLVPERDPDALAGALSELAGRPERWAEMGRAGRAHVEHHYDAGRRARELAGVLEEARETAAANRSSRRAFAGGPRTARRHGWTGT